MLYNPCECAYTFISISTVCSERYTQYKYKLSFVLFQFESFSMMLYCMYVCARVCTSFSISPSRYECTSVRMCACVDVYSCFSNCDELLAIAYSELTEMYIYICTDCRLRVGIRKKASERERETHKKVQAKVEMMRQRAREREKEKASKWNVNSIQFNSLKLMSNFAQVEIFCVISLDIYLFIHFLFLVFSAIPSTSSSFSFCKLCHFASNCGKYISIHDQ